jgi:DNA-binding CsgD family transcriptional regulator
MNHTLLALRLLADADFSTAGWAFLGLLGGMGLTTLWHRNRKASPSVSEAPTTLDPLHSTAPAPPVSAPIKSNSPPSLLLSECELKTQVLDYVVSHILPITLEQTQLKQQTEHVLDQFRLIGLLQRLNQQDEQRLPDDFESRLQQAHPDLTEEELKLCVYAYLGFNSRQIAQLKNISPAGVNKARTRLRKKLQLQADVTLDNFIRKSRGESPQTNDLGLPSEQL